MSLLDEYKKLQEDKAAGGGQSGRKSVLQEYVESKGTSGLNEKYVDTALSNGGGFGFTQVSKGPTITVSKRRSVSKPESYDANIGKNGWQKYLNDQEKAKIDAKAAEDAKPWWEKLLGYLGEAQDTTMSMGVMPDVIESYRNDTSYQQPNDDWTDDERYVFGYLYNESSAKAAAYADSLNAAINEDKKSAQVQEVQDKATKSGWAGAAHTAGAILTAPLGMADYLDDLAQSVARGEIRDHGNISPFEYSQAVTGGVSEHLNEKHGTLNENIPVIGGKGWGDVYGLGTSIAQSALAGYTGGGGQALVQFFGSAAAAGTDDALSRGATADQAVKFGTMSGVAEGLMEMVGVDNLLKIGSSATMRELVINIAKQGAAEALEEGGTTLLNNFADQLIMQDKSNFHILMQDYVDKGWSEEEAKQQAWRDMVEDIAYDMLGGFVSGAAHAGPQTAYQTIAQNVQNKRTYGDSEQELVAEGLASAEGSLNRKLADKYQAKLASGGTLTGAEISRLIRANEQQFLAEDMDTIKQTAERRLIELGEFENATAVAEVLAKQAAKQKLTRAEKAVLQTSKYGQRVANEMNPGNIESGAYTTGWAQQIGTNRVNAEAYNAGLQALADEMAGVTPSDAAPAKAGEETVAAAGNLTTKATMAVTERFTASGEGRISIADMGKVKIASTEGGKMTLKTEGGKTVKAEDVSFRSEDEAMVYSAVLDMGVSPVVAQSIVDNFDGTDGRLYAADVKLAYQYGKMNFPKSYLAKLDIKPHQAEHAYNLGRSDAKAEVIQPKTKRTVKGKRGTVTFETAVDESTLTPIQKASLNGIKAIADLSGLNVHVFESQLTPDGYKFSLPDGTVTGANGWYVTGTNDIWIDLNAGNAGEGTMLYTAAHEISHFIKEWSPAKWRVLADFLLEQYGEDVPLDALLERQMAKIRKRDPSLHGNALMDAAYEELVCDAMSEMLVDGEVVQKLSELKRKDRTLWEKIKEVIHDLLEKWGLIRKEYEGRDVAGEAEFLRGMDEAFKKLQQLYTEAFAEASDNFAAAADEVLQSRAKPVADSEIVTDGAVVVDGNGNKFSIRSMKADIAEGKMFDDLMKYCGWSQARVNELRNQLTALVAYMEPHRDILDMNETYGREGRKFSPYKPNSDPLYQISMDFSTLCSKRLLTQYVIENLQLRENRPMSAEEQMAVRDMLIEYRQVEKGLQVACAMCYVEAARLKSPKQMQRWLNDPAPLLRDYFGKQNKAFNDSVKEAQADFKESRGYARNAPKKVMKAADVKELNKIGPKMREQYQLSAEEQKIVERAKSLPNSTYLTAGNLATLSETDPVIYHAYTSFVRTATRSKSLETDEPYYYGDSTRDNGNGIIVSDSFIEAVNRENGMRFSSWSDWRIQHLLDYITAVIDNSVRGAAMHGYTKFAEEVRVLGKTGMMFNLSGVTGTQTGLNPDGSLNFSPTESIDINDAIELREEFPETAGLQCIGVSDEHIFALLRSDIIDYVIPYHVSGLNKGLRRMADIHGWKDYTETQHAAIDKSVKNNGQEHWHEEPVYSEFFVGYDTGMTGEEAMQESARRYVEMCRERGLTPKFEKFSKEPGYWKLLVDRKMINQKTGELIRQKPVTPTFDFDAIKAVVDRYVENYDSGLEARALNHVVKNWDSVPGRIRDLKKGKKTKPQQALDTLSNEMLAAKPKEDGEMKLSDRDAEATGQYADGVKFSERVTDKATLDFLNGQKTITTYKTMQLVDGKLYPPMAARTEGKYEDYSILGQWEQATEHPELITDGNQYKLDKGKGQGSLKAAYNPYMHSSNLVLNDQFSGAYSRPQLVTVECEVPVSELTSGYHAQYAKDSVGWHAWHTGTVAGQLRKARGIERQVFLSRWIKPVRIVPDAEVAGMYKELLDGTNIAVPDNVVTPSLLVELKKAGVKTKESGKIKTAGDVKYSERDFAEQVDEVFAGTFARGNAVYVGKTPDILQQIGLNGKLPMLTTAKHILNATKPKDSWRHQHGLTEAQVKSLPEKIAAPVMVMDSLTGANSIVVVTDMVDPDKSPVVVTIKADGRGMYNNVEIDTNFVTSYYGRDAFDGFIADNVAAGNILYVNRKKATALAAESNTSWFEQLKSYDFDTIVRQTRANVKMSDRDTAPTFYSHMARVVDAVKQEKLGAASVVNMLRGKGVKAEEIKWSGIEAWLEGKKSVTKAELQEFIAGSMLQIKETVLGAGARLMGEDGTSYESETDFKDAAYAIADEQGIDRSRVKFVIDTDDTMEAYAYVGNPMNHILWASILESKGASARWGQYKLDGGSNYREIVFTMPDSDYGNKAMHVHWGDNVDGVLAHARIQDMPTASGRMLFVEEIQSDWHNEGHSKGYKTEEFVDAERAEDEAYELYMKVRRAFNKYVRSSEFNTDSEDVRKQKFDHLRGKVDAAERKWKLARQKVAELLDRGEGNVPDAPFRESYHEYVMKRLIRMAAEGGYDSIGWTTADIQSQRWSDEFAEGYRIEYDQDIPKFMNKYGKKWGAKVGKTDVANGQGKTSYVTSDGQKHESLRDAVEAVGRSAGIYYGDLQYEVTVDGAIVRNAFSGEVIDKISVGTDGQTVWSMTITPAMKQSVLYEGQPLYSERDTDSVSHRDLLAGAFEGIAQNDIERSKIEEYRKKVKQLNEQEQKLAEIRKELGELSFARGPRDTARITELREEATKISNRIGIYDKQLLRLEASAPLMAVLEREKKLAYSRAAQKWADRMETARTGRNKTEMRHKIQGIVSELNQLLLHGSKDKHVMIGLQKATAEALSAINMDTVAAEERLAKIQAKIDRATDPAEIAKLQQTYARIEEMGMNMNARLAALKNAYEDIKDSGDPLIAGAYQPEIEERIKNLRKMVGETPLRNMSMEQLEFTYDTYKMVLTTIRNANKAFKNAKGETIATLGNRAMEEIETVGGKKTLAMKAMRGPLSFAWSGLKPTYAFKAIGSDTLSEMFETVRAGEDTWAVDVSEAKEFYRQKTQQYHFDSWDFLKQYSFTSKTGKTFNLTLEQIMSLYAYSKRKQADAHLDKGGFVFDDAIEVVQKKHGIPVKYTVKTADAHNLSRDTLMAICGTLTEEQVKFVDEMQEYLSTTMGAKGNEVSLEMYGVKLFKEKFYFPLKSAKQYMFEQNEVAGEVKIKNSGFSKETVQHASNPVILSNFTEVWATHVNDMAMYHAFVLPLEDFNRVFNYKTPNAANMDTESVKMFLQNAYGRQPEQYIRQLLTDLNGGARSDPNAGVINKMIGIFKKSAVFASLSVVVQQPSAIARAAAYVDTKYFVGKPSTKAWEEVKKYAPIAIIKEMGYFDTNMGVSTTEFIKAKEYHGAKAKMAALVTDSQYRDEILSKAPAVADELAWCQIWEAVKKEQAAKGLKGEELLQAAGKRFTEVIVNTQVYDSVLSRSGMMRSKDTGVKMATAFMAEPTTSLNMITDAIIQGKRGNKKYARKAIGSVIASMILNSVLVSFVYAGRDDDEDKTYAEKYVGTLTGELIDSFNPLTMIPFVKDIVSIAQGYDVERSDMAVVTDLYKAWKNLSSSNRSTYRKVEDFGGAVAAIFGLPVKNIMRDVRGMYNTVMSFVNGTKTTSFGVGEAARENLPKIVGGGERSNSDELYRAMLAGDAQHTERVKSRFKDERAVAYAIRDGLVANDARITAAAEARVAGNQSEYLRLAREITGEGHFTQDDVVRAINYVTDKLRKGETESTSSLSAPDTFKVADYYNEAVSGDQAEAALVKREIISGMVADGKTAEEAEKSFNNSFKNSAVKPAFTEGDISVERAIAMLQNYGGLTEDAAAADVEYWAFSQNYPNIPVEDSWFDAYYKYAADVNIPVDTYMTYRNDVRGITGDGKKARRMAVIDSLPLTYEQKDALYYSEGWAASTIWEAPWH